MEFDARWAKALSKIVHKECKDVPHDIGIKLAKAVHILYMCKYHQVQNCHCCPDYSCGDNINKPICRYKSGTNYYEGHIIRELPIVFGDPRKCHCNPKAVGYTTDLGGTQTCTDCGKVRN